MPQYPWRVVGTPEVIVNHPWRRIVDFNVQFSDGSTQIRTVDENTGGAGILAINGEDEVLLLNLDHFASKLVGCLELPGGRLGKNEPPIEAAKRELLEETGIVAEHWEPIFDNFYRFPTFSNSNHRVFLATGLRDATEAEKEGIESDANELINGIIFMPVKEALAEIGTGIVDSATIAALQWLQIKRLK